MDTYEVRQATDATLGWLARRKVRRAQREGRTGLLAFTRIPAGTRSIRYKRYVLIKEGRRCIFAGQPGIQIPRWVDLPPGGHELTFSVSGGGDISFTRHYTLNAGDILIAGCHTTYSIKLFDENRRPNYWYIGILH
ncbi:hypothetical protein [Amycolatopsis sp. GM8]|uniref:hypothetical protein n=1 Tax=Amycolatopsis sp. GM8 TaxID=2896530 RepID=UPI001F1F7562|nr:hypothetical protein [Amycolatopsis sp. GM8]